MIQCITDAYKSQGLSDDTVDDFFREHSDEITDFLSGKGENKLFFYFQIADTTSEFGETVDANEHPRLFLTDGENERIKGKAVYFARAGPEGKPVSSSGTTDGEVVFGELSPQPIMVLDSIFTPVYMQLIKRLEEGDWGQCETEQKKEFNGVMTKFSTELGEAIKSLTTGIELRKVDRRFEARFKSMSAPRLASDQEVVKHCEEVFKDWLKVIDDAVEEGNKQEMDKKHLESGPHTELDFWRQRMQKLTSIQEQLKSKDCKAVFAVLNQANNYEAQRQRGNVYSLLTSWKNSDIKLTEASNEAKDNVQYLTTLEKFIEPLYNGTPLTIMDTLPALMNSIKMIHTIARYYNTSERMTHLFMKITNQMISNCKQYLNDGKPGEKLWDKKPQELIERLEHCTKLNTAYYENYNITKEKLMTMPKGKQFDFSESQIFGKFDNFCRRLLKLIDLFNTIQQFNSLEKHNLDGMQSLIKNFKDIITEFKKNISYDLLDFTDHDFDRKFVQFNVDIAHLEAELQKFIDEKFDNVQTSEDALVLLKKFQNILVRESLKNDLTNKNTLIFQKYGNEIKSIQNKYTSENQNPPIQRNMPPVAGNIQWARHLLQKVSGPMQNFSNIIPPQNNPGRFIRSHNKIAITLTTFEYLFLQAWCNEIEKAKAGLQATLIIRHPENRKLYVNFDMEIMQLIREAKCLDRLGGIEIPESAKIVLLQEEKFKMYYNELLYVLKEYDRVYNKIRPITKALLSPHLEDLEYKLRPGMVTLTWTSMNIDGYLHHVHSGLNKLEQLIISINDIVENRVENNLKSISKVMLVRLPDDGKPVSLDDFVEMQEKAISSKTELLVSKNIEVENAVDDLLATICAYQLDPHVEPISDDEIRKLKKYYNWTMYQALLHSTKNSLNAMKERVCGKRGENVNLKPFFVVEVKLDGQIVKMSPTLDEIQKSINKAAIFVLRCSKFVFNWDQRSKSEEEKESFYDMIAQDKEIVKVILLLTGSIQGTRNQVNNYIESFEKYKWLWNEDIEEALAKYAKRNPNLDLADYEEQLKKFVRVEEEVDRIDSTHQIGAMSLKTESLKLGLKDAARQWKIAFSNDLHKKARSKLEELTDYIKSTAKTLNTPVKDIDTLKTVMDCLQEIRAKEAVIDLEFGPIIEMYSLLDTYLPSGILDKDEIDSKTILKRSWENLIKHSEEVQDELQQKQSSFEENLRHSVKEFTDDVQKFRKNYLANGPMVAGIPPKEALGRLRRYREEFAIRERTYIINYAGEELFGMQHRVYPELSQTQNELRLLQKLYDLYGAVVQTVDTWKEKLWSEVIDVMDEMISQCEDFSKRCKKLPMSLREWPAYIELKSDIDGFSEKLPLIKELAKPSIKPRHWQEVMDIMSVELNYTSEMFSLNDLLNAPLLEYKDDVEDITDSADKQLKIESDLQEITELWDKECFDFTNTKRREEPCILVGGKVQDIQENLEESQAKLNTMNALRHVAPFRSTVVDKLMLLSDVSDTIEKWIKVQVLWTSLEPVFTGGDIAKQMPLEAKKFNQIDRNWIKIMERAHDSDKGNVISCCQNDMLKSFLPTLQQGLEECQKQLENYLETKRGKFPRFYFVANPTLLKILSQGSDPNSVQDDFEKLFDAITRVEFDKVDRKSITKIMQVQGKAKEIVTLTAPIKAEGNIEDWLKNMEAEMQRSIKDIAREGARDCMHMHLGEFIDKYISQIALLGIQIIWTARSQEALEKFTRDKTIMDAKKKEFQAMMDVLTDLCLSDLESSLVRTKIETLVTIQVHQRELFLHIAQLSKIAAIKDANDFEWLKQTRLSWRTDLDNCAVNITDVEFYYCYEYLGAKDRLCITPLTDRCYITLAQALGMNYGGAPAGPAGTGKTETVKDMGRTLGIYVVVTNCTDQHRFRDMAKIFKGLCMSGLWGCFDEFNRIELEVLSVVAMQIEAITSAKKSQAKSFFFPGERDLTPITLIPTTAYFITMNPGYAGRQELPENLKVLFRGVAMMVPDREIIIKVKLASVGYRNFEPLAKKFRVLYGLCEEQLSKQRHYDFGLRNILSVLRTAGNTKRREKESDEEMLIMRSLRDMNLSKLVADDVPLFNSLLADIFKVRDPPKQEYAELSSSLKVVLENNKLINHPSWFIKIIQLYETSLVRHGYMIVGPSGSGKTTIVNSLTSALTHQGNPHKIIRMNPKAITSQEMYGVKDPVSGDWTPGVFSAIWSKCNSRSNKHTSWIACDGPVDAIWIENLNTVLDDNKILTLANGDRILMTENCKLTFEVENLNNASPATVSRCGIVFVSASDLGWEPVIDGWLRMRSEDSGEMNYQYVNRPEEAEHLRTYLHRYLLDNGFIERLPKVTTSTMDVGPVLRVTNILNLLTGVLKQYVDSNQTVPEVALEKIVLYSIIWGLGGLLEPEDRIKMHEMLESEGAPLPRVQKDETVFEYWVDPKTKDWSIWAPQSWKLPSRFQFSQLLIPTMDSTRAEYIIDMISNQDYGPLCNKSVLLIGGSGTAKTSTVLMHANKFNPNKMVFKKINFSSATLPDMFQASIEGDIERKTGRRYIPAGNKTMSVFIDDMSLPFVNEWGDQVTLEIVRQLVESKGFYFLDKDKRGDFKEVEALQFIGAMNHPGGGRNDIPNRLKRQFFIFNMVLPSQTSVDNIYGSILKATFTAKKFNGAVVEAISKLTSATIVLWNDVKDYLKPTPSKFHYLFNMRELSRVFQGLLNVYEHPEVVLQCQSTGGKLKPDQFCVALWKHECERVFGDKLSTQKDKDWLIQKLSQVTADQFSEEVEDKVGHNFLFADFMREDVYNADGELDEEAPQIYEAIPNMEILRARVAALLKEYNEENPAKKMDLVLFDDALGHMLRISRIIQMPRGSALLVGVGGSGKQSLTRLASFIGKQKTFQITLTKSYNTQALFDDLKQLYRETGVEGKKVTFIFTDAEVKKESFLEYINSCLSTGEIANLLQKDEKDTWATEVRPAFGKDRPHIPEPTMLDLYNYLIDRVRDNLHVVLCMSPVGAKFRERSRKFPALFNSCTIDWFLPWPEEALVSVSQSFIAKFDIDCTPQVKQQLESHMGTVHNLVTEVCEKYFQRMRRHVYVTPKSYLSFIQSYQQVYAAKKDEIEVQERSVLLGLKKLKDAAIEIDKMKEEIAREEIKLKEASEKTEKLLGELQVESAKAEKKRKEVLTTKEACEGQAAVIAKEREAADRDLQAALPYLHEAKDALSKIQPKDIVELKTVRNAADIIKLVFDGVCLLMMNHIVPVKEKEIVLNKAKTNFMADSFDESGKPMMLKTTFLNDIFDFSNNKKDNINDETCELLEPYLNLENFNASVAKNASKAAEGLCIWVRAMVMYHEASKIVKPKQVFLEIQESRLAAALEELGEAEKELKIVEDQVAELNTRFEDQISEKNAIQEQANRTRKKMEQANRLLTGLSDERLRWTDDAANFADRKRRLVGDVAVSCAFVSYCGPFNSEFRKLLFIDYFSNDCIKREIPLTDNLELTKFLVDQGTVGEWNLQGLPTDDLSIQNGIMVTRSSRYPLLIDPQGQASQWIKRREAENLEAGPFSLVTNINASNLKDILKFAMGEGKSMIIEGIENEVDPLLDPVLEKQIVKKSKSQYISVADQQFDYEETFQLFMTSRLANPHFSPELSAKTTVIDFTVTQTGLEQQLLGRVLSKEQKVLEESLQQLLEDVTNNIKALQKLDKDLLRELTENDTPLLDNVELIEILANTKAKAREVSQKLQEAEERKTEINEKREQYRPVATRGSVLYFCMVEMSLINWMYNSSLNQFLGLFDDSIDKSEKAQLPQKRVENIIDFLTYYVYRYVNRGLFEKDKITFTLIICMKIMVTAGQLTYSDVGAFLRSGAALDIKSERANQFSKWMPDKTWLNVLALGRHNFAGEHMPFFKDLVEFISRNESLWKDSWFDDNEPERAHIPDYEERIKSSREIGSFIRLTLVRSLREDRTVIAATNFINDTLGKRFTDPVTDSMESIWSESDNRTPVLFLLSAGADPTSSIDDLAKKKKKFPTYKVSMGEGQEGPAFDRIKAGFQNGDWVILQNCHLGLGFMSQLEEILGDPAAVIDPDFRLWLTGEPHPKFPIGLLQLAIKVTNEPPKGLKAGLHRTFTTIINQDFMEKIDIDKWRTITYVICFLHSIVQERRKFGPLGWCVPYEFNNSDLEASLSFLEKHISANTMPGSSSMNNPINWPTVKYMITEVQYGGRITDDLDGKLFKTYGNAYLNDKIFTPNFTFPGSSTSSSEFVYKIPDGMEIQKYREYIDQFPQIDKPEIFGLHANADLTFRTKEASEMLFTIMDTQPKETSSGSGKSREEIVQEKAEELLGRLPADFVEAEYREIISKLAGPKQLLERGERGFRLPLNVFLFQEIQRMQHVTGLVKKTLTDISDAVDGKIIMTPEIVDAINAIFDARVPGKWLYDPSGAEISWLMPTLGLWFNSLLDRYTQLNGWLRNGRLTYYHLGNFFNPQGFLTAMKQEVTRQHKNDKGGESWSLDDVEFSTEVLTVENPDKLKDAPPEGVYIHGLFLEGCRWVVTRERDREGGGHLEESHPKVLFHPLPVMHVSAVSKERRDRDNYRTQGSNEYKCPVYKYPRRTDKYIIFTVGLKCPTTGNKGPEHWRLRGVALLCSKD